MLIAPLLSICKMNLISKMAELAKTKTNSLPVPWYDFITLCAMIMLCGYFFNVLRYLYLRWLQNNSDLNCTSIISYFVLPQNKRIAYTLCFHWLTFSDSLFTWLVSEWTKCTCSCSYFFFMYLFIYFINNLQSFHLSINWLAKTDIVLNTRSIILD